MYERVPTFIAGHELAEETFAASTSNVHGGDSTGSQVWENVFPRSLSNNSVGRNVDRPSTGNGYPVANLACLMASTGLKERSRVNTTRLPHMRKKKKHFTEFTIYRRKVRRSQSLLHTTSLDSALATSSFSPLRTTAPTGRPSRLSSQDASNLPSTPSGSSYYSCPEDRDTVMRIWDNTSSDKSTDLSCQNRPFTAQPTQCQNFFDRSHVYCSIHRCSPSVARMSSLCSPLLGNERKMSRTGDAAAFSRFSKRLFPYSFSETLRSPKHSVSDVGTYSTVLGSPPTLNPMCAATLSSSEAVKSRCKLLHFVQRRRYRGPSTFHESSLQLPTCFGASTSQRIRKLWLLRRLHNSYLKSGALLVKKRLSEKSNTTLPFARSNNLAYMPPSMYSSLSHDSSQQSPNDVGRRGPLRIVRQSFFPLAVSHSGCRWRVIAGPMAPQTTSDIFNVCESQDRSYPSVQKGRKQRIKGSRTRKNKFPYPTRSLQLQRHYDSPNPDASFSAISGSKNPALSQRNVSAVDAGTSFSVFFWDEFYCRRCPRHSATRAQPTQGEKHSSTPRSVSVPFFDVIPKNSIRDLFHVPLRLEKTLALGFCICLECLLYELTLMPVQAALGIFQLCRCLVCIMWRFVRITLDSTEVPNFCKSKFLVKKTFVERPMAWFAAVQSARIALWRAACALSCILLPRRCSTHKRTRGRPFSNSRRVKSVPGRRRRKMVHTLERGISASCFTSHSSISEAEVNRSHDNLNAPRSSNALNAKLPDGNNVADVVFPLFQKYRDASSGCSAQQPMFYCKNAESPAKKSCEHKQREFVLPHLSPPQACDLTRTIILVVGIWLFNMFVDVSEVYHFIRAQSMMKLYVVFNMLEIFERLWRSLGRDALDSLMRQIVALCVTDPSKKHNVDAFDGLAQTNFASIDAASDVVADVFSDHSVSKVASCETTIPCHKTEACCVASKTGPPLPLPIAANRMDHFASEPKTDAPKNASVFPDSIRSGATCSSVYCASGAAHRERPSSTALTQSLSACGFFLSELLLYLCALIYDFLLAFQQWVKRKSIGGFAYSDVQRTIQEWRPWIATVVRLTLSLALALLYVVVHAFTHLLRALLLNIAINSSDSVMFLIATTNNFAEIKSTVFKKFTKTTLFTIVASDAVERFYLFADGFIVFLRLATSVRTPLTSYVTVIRWLAGMLFLELVVDWFKHYFLLKLNFLPTKTFDEYRQVLLADILTSRRPDEENVDDQINANASRPDDITRDWVTPCRSFYSFPHICSRRLGFIALPLTAQLLCSMPRFPWKTNFVTVSLTFVLLWACLLTLKVIVSLLLVSFGVQRQHRLTVYKHTELQFLSPL